MLQRQRHLTSWPPPPRQDEVSSARGQSTRGQALAEFAIALPLFLILILGIIDFGRMILIHSAVVSASREGARYGAAAGDLGGPRIDCPGIRNAVRGATGSLVTVTDNQIQISYVDGAGGPTTASCEPHGTGPIASEIDSLDRVVVRVTVPYQAIVPMVHAIVGPITVVSEDRRTIAMAGP